MRREKWPKEAVAAVLVELLVQVASPRAHRTGHRKLLPLPRSLSPQGPPTATRLRRGTWGARATPTMARRATGYITTHSPTSCCGLGSFITTETILTISTSTVENRMRTSEGGCSPGSGSQD